MKPAILVGVAMLLAAPLLSAVQQAGHVEVTVPRANVRETPTLDGRVVTQVTAGTTLPVQAVEGDWYKVRVSMGGVQFEAYIAKSVVRFVEPPAGAGAPAAASPTETVRNGMSVAWQVGENTTWLVPQTTGVAVVPGRQNGLEALAAALPPADAPPAAAGGAPVTWVWTLPAEATGPEVTEPRPWFFVQLQEGAGLDVSKLTAEIVRVAPAPSGVQLLAGVPGRADQTIWGDADWDVMRTMQQRPVRATIETLAPGTIRLRPDLDLPPATYVVVVRPAGRDRLAGADVLRGRGIGLVFAVAWPFSVK